jgi:GH15 family glucan-1,4-alpha-glucosidase
VPLRIEDYAMIGDRHTGALVGRDGSIDWLCLPRFDSGACFAALLGDERHGRWLIAPVGEVRAVRRRYRDGSLVLETEMDTDEGTVRIVDCMPERGEAPDVVRVVEGVRGRVRMRTEILIRTDYGSIVPWVRKLPGGEGITAIAGPDALVLHAPVQLKGEELRHTGEFTVPEGEQVPFVLTWYPSHHPVPKRINGCLAVEETDKWWKEWSGRTEYHGDWGEAVQRSLITLKALTYMPTGGIVAAPTTSLPEQLGGVRNWDYRFCWLRDATFTLYSLMTAGYVDEAQAWRDWLLRAVAGSPDKLQIMYGAAGERRLHEYEVDWLPGYEGAAPVRVGNAAAGQFQLDVWGEVMDAMHQSRRAGIEANGPSWELQKALLDFLEGHWDDPDEGIWEVRGPRRHFTHSKVMAWVALDRAVAAVEQFGHDGPVDRWRQTRDEVHRQVCEKGWSDECQAFVQSYGSKDLDASVLMIPLVGFLPASDERVVKTVAAIEKRLVHKGFVRRYTSEGDVDGLPPGEGAFLACTFWLADNLEMQGRSDDARELFERLLSLRNDVGLLSEEYDPDAERLVGNFPQAFSHVALVNTARNLTRHNGGPRMHRHNHDH